MVKLVRSTGLREQQDRSALSDRDLEALHKSELSACLEANREWIPRPEGGWITPFSPEHPLAKLHEQHQREWAERVATRDKVTKTLTREEAREAKKEEAAAAREAKLAAKAEKATQSAPAPRENRCLGCQKVIPPTGKRGRPPTRCEPCKAQFEAEQAETTTNGSRECGACKSGKGRHLATCKKQPKKPTRRFKR